MKQAFVLAALVALTGVASPAPAVSPTTSPLTGPTATPTAGPTPGPFYGITIYEPLSQLIAEHGDPYRSDAWAYYYIRGNTSELVMVAGGIVDGLTLNPGFPGGNVADAPSPLGIHIGSPATDVVKIDPSRIIGDPSRGLYRGDDGVMFSFAALQGVEFMIFVGPLSPARHDRIPMPTLHSGTSIDDAIVLKDMDDTDSVHSEYLYLFWHPCSTTARTGWKASKQSLLRQGGKVYDRMDVICPVDQAQNTFYFDITDTIDKKGY